MKAADVTPAMRRQDQLAMLSRLEWIVLRGPGQRCVDHRWFAHVSADAPELAFRISA